MNLLYTQEELKMLAKDNEYMEETVEALYVANADEIVRQQCRAREDAERRERTLERDNKKLKEELADLERKQKLTEILLSQNRFEELKMVQSDTGVLERLYKELGIK